MHQWKRGDGFMHSIYFSPSLTLASSLRVHSKHVQFQRVCAFYMSYAMWWYTSFQRCLSWHVIRIYWSRFIQASIIWFIISSISQFTCWYRIISGVLFRLYTYIYVLCIYIVFVYSCTLHSVCIREYNVKQCQLLQKAFTQKQQYTTAWK